jgi:hypothetical protein
MTSPAPSRTSAPPASRRSRHARRHGPPP